MTFLWFIVWLCADTPMDAMDWFVAGGVCAFLDVLWLIKSAVTGEED